MIPQPFDAWFDAPPRRVLIAGAGGGFDIIAGMPVALAIERKGHHVELANLTWSSMASVDNKQQLAEGLWRIDASSNGGEYFPEGALAKWRKQHGANDRVYCLQQCGGRPLRAIYRALVDETQADTIVLVDGGVDSLLRGDEHSLGTPTADALSIAAALDCDVPGMFLATLAFGAERHDRIAHIEALERMANLTAEGAFLGSESIVSTGSAGSEFGKLFASCADFVQDAHPPYKNSIVVSTMQSALRGDFGERSVNARTEQTPIWVSPLAAMAFYFDLRAVGAAKPYLAALRDTDHLLQASAIIEAFWGAAPARPFTNIPI
ncbi:MAG: DUF1152 domain-containing protein [Polyangiaceae bacterium]